MKISRKNILTLILLATIFTAMLLLSACKDKDEEPQEPHVEINSFTLGYLTEELYNEGVFNDNSLTETIDLTNGQTGYMVVDFSYTVLREIDSGRHIFLETFFPGRGVIDLTIEEAPTSVVREIESTSGTTVKAGFTIRGAVGETNSVRVIMRLLPLSGGEIFFELKLTPDNYDYPAENSIKISGSNLISRTITAGEPDVIYTINPDGRSYSVTSARKDLTDIVIPDKLRDGLPVTAIADGAFKSLTALSCITLGENLVHIGASAFEGCTALASISIPESVLSIDSRAFLDTNLSVTENGVHYIDKWVIGAETDIAEAIIRDGTVGLIDRAFDGCCELTGITMPESIISIGAYAFNNCKTIGNILLPENLVHLGEYALAGCEGLIEIALPGGIGAIPKHALHGCSSLKDLSIGNAITSIGDHAFAGCSALVEINIPDSITAVGASAFEGCSALKSADMGKGLTSIGKSAFAGCISIEEITTPFAGSAKGQSDNCHFGYIFGAEFEGDNKKSVPGSLKTVRLNGDAPIGNKAFFGCVGLRNVIIGDGVTAIGSDAFTGCTGLTYIEIGKSVGTIGDYAFYRCSSLTEVDIPDSVKSVAHYAFYGCSALQSFNIPSGAEFIGNYAFYDCKSLSEITIPKSVASVGESAFEGCSALADVYYTGDADDWRALVIKENNIPLTDADIHCSFGKQT